MSNPLKGISKKQRHRERARVKEYCIRWRIETRAGRLPPSLAELIPIPVERVVFYAEEKGWAPFGSKVLEAENTNLLHILR